MKKQNTIVSSLYLLGIILFMFSCSSGVKSLKGPDGYILQYHMDKGTEFSISSSSSMESVLDQMGNEIVTNVNGTGENKMVVLSKEKEKGLSVEMEFVKATQDVESPMGSGSTDYSKLIGKKVTFDLIPTGDVKNMKGFDQLPTISTASGETITEELYKLGIQATFFNLPNKPIKIGDEWTEQDTTEIPLGDYTLTSENSSIYKLVEEVKKDGYDCLKIKTTGIQNLSGEFEQNGQPLSIQRETKSNGVVYFAYQKGMFLQIEANSEAEGLITVVGAGMELPQKNTTEANITVTFVK
jgi:hypothetical protein